MKKILLTGGSGFIGRNILESDLALKYDICAPKSAELNLADTACTDEFFKNKSFDAVWHFAVKPGHRNAKDPTNLLYNNLRLFENLARHQDKFGKLINAGSGAVYDVSADNANVSETDMFKHFGTDEHSYCKYVVAKRIEALPGFVDLNIFGVFGKYEDYAIRFISNAICKTVFGLPITLRQNRRFSYLDVADLMPVLAYFTENEAAHHSYNVVPDGFAELKEIALLIQKTGGSKNEIKVEKDGHGLDYYGSNARLKSEMPQLSFTPLQTSIERLYAYYEGIKDQLNYQSLLTDK